MTEKNPAQAEDEFILPAAAAEDGPDGPGNPDETVEVTHEGRTYQVPKVLKGALMRHADYTRKTQELAQQRKAAEAAQEAAAEGDALHRHGLARLQALDAQLAPFAQVDMAALPAPKAALLARHVAKLKAARDQTARALQIHQRNQALALQQARARQVEQGRARLRQDIEDWSPETARRIAQAGKVHGFSDGEIHSVTDPRMILVLNKARLWDEYQAGQARTKRLMAAQGVKPATEVGAEAPAAHDPSRMSTAEWMRWRGEQLRKKR